jgi:hypothetical protein
MLSVVVPNATMLGVIMLNYFIVILSCCVALYQMLLLFCLMLVVIMPNDFINMLCHYTKFDYAKCCCAICHNAGCHFAVLLYCY